MTPTNGLFLADSPLGCRLHDWNIGAREQVDGVKGGRGLILDLDDTLYPREHFVQSGLMAIARFVEERHAIPAMDAYATMRETRRNGGAGREFQALCARHGLPAEHIAVFLDFFREHLPLLRLPKETASVLARVRADGWRLVVLTNGIPAMQRRKVKALGLSSYVDGVVCADEHAPGGKPAWAAFRAAQAMLGISAGDCVCVGDDLLRDIGGARALGMRTVWLSAHVSAPVVMSGADVQIASLSELPDALTGLQNMVNRDAA